MFSHNSRINYFYSLIIFLIFFYVSIEETLTFIILCSLVISFFFFKLYIEINIHIFILILTIVFLNNLNFYKIEEKHNIFIPNKLNEKKYTKFINKKDYLILTEQFLKKYKTKKNVCQKDNPSCWENLEIIKGISHELTFFNEKKNYSRLVTKINHNNLASLKINQTNSLNLNFFGKNIFTRDKMPYFTIYKFPKFYNGSRICFKGYLILDNSLNHYNDARCIKIFNNNEYLFFNFDYLDVKLKKNFKILILENLFLLLKIIVFFLIFKKSSFNQKDFFNKFFIIALSILSFVYFFYRKEDFVFGYHALNGGMDGLLYESFSKDIFINFINANFVEALRGNEDVFYFMPGMRYFLFIEKLLFANNFYLIYLLMIFLPLNLYFFLKIFFNTNLSLLFTFLFIIFNVPHLGFGSSIYYKSFLTLYPEALTLFFIIQGLIQIHNKNYFSGSLFLVFSIFLRPNFLPFILIISLTQILILFHRKHYINLTKYLIGISLFLLIPLHNLAFHKDKFYFLTSSTNITSNKVLKLSDFKDFITKNKNNEYLINHLKNFVDTGINKKHVFYINLFLLINLFIFFPIYIRKLSTNDKMFVFATLIQIIPSLFFINVGRFSHIIWFFILISNFIILKNFINTKKIF